LTAGQLCTLACCAALPPHAAGSCMHGSCHAKLAHQTHRPTQTENFCGAHRLLHATGLAPHDATPQPNNFVTNVIGHSCPPDCCAGTGCATSQHRPRETALITHAARPRPPTRLRLHAVTHSLTYTRNARGRQSAPRAPPLDLA
jgi:hypothetical protein